MKMKIIISITILFIAFTSVSYSQSVMNFQNGSGVEVQAGADICADQININGTFSGGGTICGGLIYTLNLTVFIQGFYNAPLDIMVPDTLTAYLRNSFAPYAIVDSAKSVLSLSGAGSFLFYNAVNGTNYYVVTQHRNALETWSSTATPFVSGAKVYDFTPAANKAYGSNEIQIDLSPVKFAIYSGDINHDGSINLTDIIDVYNGGINFLTGYVITDVTGDDIVDLTDLLMTYNNSSNFISKVTP